MADDHYVAQTYLKHFASSSGLLRAYRKSDTASFPCRPRDICKEPNGDIIPDFLSEPQYLGQYRSEFERVWNHGIHALEGRSLNMQDKLYIAGYWAQLLVCTPTWTRAAIKTSDLMASNTIAAYCEIKAQRGEPDAVLEAAMEEVKRGDITINTERDYVRAHSAQNVLEFAWALYNSQWDVFENNTEIEFLTSDNPASCEDQGERWRMPGSSTSFIRYLPVTPRLCLMCDLTPLPPRIRDATPDFSKKPFKTVRGGQVGQGIVEQVNMWTVKCAEDLVLTTGESNYARDLTARYARFGIDSEVTRFPTSRGYLLSNRTRCIERKDK